MSGSGSARELPALQQPANPISRRRVETVMSRSIALFGIVFGAQAIPTALGQVHETGGAWFAVAAGALALALLVAVVCSLIRRGVRTAHAAVSLVYMLALASWTPAVVAPLAPTENHWLYLLLTVATATAAIAFPTRLAIAYLVAVPLLYGVLRGTPAGGGASWERGLIDAGYAIILGAAVQIIVSMLRQASSSVDSAQSTALARYAVAVRQHATEVERVEVDSIVHDSVLTTLLSAAKARTPESQRIAATMAGNAMRHLRDAARAPGDGEAQVPAGVLVARLVEAADGMAEPFELRGAAPDDLLLPQSAADTLYSAAVQAMVNSIQHAGRGPEVVRWIALAAGADGGVRIAIGDTGAGFDPASVREERLGVRVSILERVGTAGGTAAIESAPGRGTVVALEWPAEAVPVPKDLRAEEVLR